MGHPRGINSRYVIGCCVIPLEICGVENNSRRITYGIGCVWGMPSLSPLPSLVLKLLRIILKLYEISQKNFAAPSAKSLIRPCIKNVGILIDTLQLISDG